MKKYLALLLVLLLFVAACEIEKPHLPSWDIDLNVPLINEKYLLSDLVDNENIFIGEDNVLYLENSGDLSTPIFGDVSFSIPLDTGEVPLLAGPPLGGSFDPQDQANGYLISYGRVATGTIKARFSDVTAGVQSISITFHGLTNAAGNPLQINYSGNNGWNSTNLSGYHMGTLNSGQILNEVGYTITVATTHPAGTHVADVEIKIDSPITFNLFQGKLDNYLLPSDGDVQTIDISYPYGIEDAIELQQARLVLNISNPIGFSCEFTGNLFAINETTGDSVSLPIKDDDNNNFVIEAGVGGVPTISELVISNGISALLQIMPHRIEVRNGAFKILPSTTVGTVRNNDQITGTYTITAPFDFILNPHEFTLDEPIELEMSEDNRERIEKYAISAGLRMQVRNMLPIGATAKLYIGTTTAIDPADSTTYELTRELTIRPVSVNSGYQELEFQISPEEMEIFTNPMIYMQMAFSFESNGMPVLITAAPSDYVQIRGMLNARVHIEEDI